MLFHMSHSQKYHDGFLQNLNSAERPYKEIFEAKNSKIIFGLMISKVATPGTPLGVFSLL